MGNFFIKDGQIPFNLNLEEIIEGVDGNKTKKKFIEDGMVYFLSLLTIDNYYHYKFKDGFRKLNNDILEFVIGKGERKSRTAEIKRILRSHGVIEIKTHRKGHYSQSFRLTETYNTGKIKRIPLSDRIQLKLMEYKDRKKKSKEIVEKDYSHLFLQFEKHSIEVDFENANIFLKDLFNKILTKTNRVHNFKDNTLDSLYNYTGRTVSLLNDLQHKNYRYSVSESNNRLHSNLTSLPRILRPFIQIDGKPIGEVDIKSSQSYILSTILTDEFMNNEKNNYNLEIIHPQLKQIILDSKHFIVSNKVSNPHFVLGVFLNDEKFKGLKRYIDFDFRNDYYQFLIDEGLRLFPEFMVRHKGFVNGRDYVKKHIMNYLFDRNLLNRDNNPVVQLMNLIFPEISNYVEQFILYIGKTEFSSLLQRTESYLILDNVCVEIVKKNKDIPYFTIHDSIISTQEHLDTISNIVFETMKSVTGKPVGVKSKNYEPLTVVSDDLVNDIWKKIKIVSKEDFENKRTYILSNNISIGKEFLLSTPTLSL